MVTSFGFWREEMFIFQASVAERIQFYSPLPLPVYLATFSVFEGSKATTVGGLRNGEQEMIWKKEAGRFAEKREVEKVTDCRRMFGGPDDIRTVLLTNTNLTR